MTNIDFTQPLALRSDPYTQVKGPFIGPDSVGIRYAIMGGALRSWLSTGALFINGESPNDIIPLQVRPVKWHTCTSSTTMLESVPMIARAPVNTLVNAMRQTLARIDREMWDSARKECVTALAVWEAGL